MNALFLTLLFAVELLAWTAVGYAGFMLGGGGWIGMLTGAVAVVLALAAWGHWAAPTADAPAAVAWIVKTAVFGSAVIGLLAVGRPIWSLSLAALIAVAHVGVPLSGGMPRR